VADVTDIFGGEIHSAANAAVLTSKLSQIASGFLYVDDADLRGNQHVVLHDEKLKAVSDIIAGNGGWPVLVFYRFDVERQLLQEHFPQARLATETGVIKAWNRGEVPILIAHPASAGHGLNLQYGGHTIVWMSLPWSLEHWQQANKRLARSGQEHPVVIHRVMARQTVDYNIFRSLTEKDAVQGSILEYLESPL
jgi:SNF2 family DNA or RNA helicase